MNFFRVIFNLFHFNRTNWKAVILCFFAAVIFWLFNSLNKNYAIDLQFPVRFTFDEARFIPASPLPGSVSMNVSGNGWDLLRRSLGFNLPQMVIPLEKPTEVKKIVGSTLPVLLAGQLGRLQINYVVTDTLHLTLDTKIKRKVKVVVTEEKFSFAEGFDRSSPIVILPDSIELEGAKGVLHKVPDSVVLEIALNRISKDVKEKVEVFFPGDERLNKVPPEVIVMFEVAEWVRVSKPLKLELLNLPSGVRMNLANDSITCSALIPKDKVLEFNQTSLAQAALIDLQGLKRGERKILPQVVGLPAYARTIVVDSVTVKLF